MGAEPFSVMRLGRTAEQAFNRARTDAQYEYGHGGYTGTIAEKHGFRMIGSFGVKQTGKTGMGIIDAFDSTYYDYDKKKIVHLNVPKALIPIVDKHLDEYEDKWGPALGYEITGKLAVEIKRRARRQGTHDKVFVFFGYASS